jgi:hypothetical protein
MDSDWTRDLKPDEARAALGALDAHQAPVTAREANESSQATAGTAGESEWLFLPEPCAVTRDLPHRNFTNPGD